MLLSLLACTPDIPCVDVRGEDALPNHVGDFDVALDVAARRAWVSSVERPTLALVDLDSGRLLSVRRPFDASPDLDHLAVGPDGRLWIWPVSAGAVGLYDGDDGVLTTVADPDVFLDATPFGDRMAVTAAVGDTREVQVRDVDGAVVARADADGTHGVAASADRIAAISATTRIYDADLALVDTVDVPFDAQHGAFLDDGSLVVAGDAMTAWITPDGVVTTWATGADQGDVVANGDEALVLDRTSADPRWGEWVVVGPAGVRAVFAAGRNTAFGALDPVTGALWVNSEGTSEVRAYSPDTGAELAAVRTGMWLDGLAVDPDRPSVRFVTGRLSQTIARVDDNSVVSANSVDWPYSPIVDEERGCVWVLSETEPAVWKLDPDTLRPLASVGIGDVDYRLTFSTLALDPTQQKLYAALAGADRVVEVDPDTLEVTRSWDLGGPALTDPKAIGELAVTADPTTAAVFVGRSNDGRIQRIDETTGALQTTWLDDDDAAALDDARVIDRTRVEPELSLFWYAGLAFSTTDLSRLPDEDLPVGTVIDRWRGAPDEWVALDDHAERLMRVHEGGDVEAAIQLAGTDQDATRGRDAGNEFLVTRARDALVCSVSSTALEWAPAE